MKSRMSFSIFRGSLAGIFFLGSIAVSHSQFVYDYKKSADNFYAKGDYYSAAQYYEQSLDPQKTAKAHGVDPYTIQKQGSTKTAGGDKATAAREEIVYRIAESYRQLNDFTHAEKYYGELASAADTKYPGAAYWYGVALRTNGKYDEARQQFEMYLKMNKANGSYVSQAKMELENCKFIAEQKKRKDGNLYSINKVIGSVNTGEANYAATWVNNTMFFTSTRPDSAAITAKNKNPYINNLYQAANTNGQSSLVEKVKLPAAENMEQGVASLTADGNRMYFTRWGKKDGVKQSAIYMSEKVNGEWGQPVMLNANVNAPDYSSQQPFVTADGKYLIFSSNMKGGQGKFDIWYAPISSNGEPARAVNMGSNVNTMDDDQAPFYHQATGTLVYASKGKIGMGGFDLYQSKGAFSGVWAESQNFGAPVNSSKDDIYFSAKSTGQLLQDASISSNRGSECCLELYSLSKQYKKYVTGIVTDCKTNLPIAGADLALSSNGSQQTKADGSYIFEINEFEALQLNASKTDYLNGNLSFNKPSVTGADTLVNGVLCLTPVTPPPPVKEPIAEEPGVVAPETKELKALFNFAKYDLRSETGTMLDSLASLLNRENKIAIEIYGYTDKLGGPARNLVLSEQRANACKDYLVDKGVSASRIKVFGKGECCPVQPETIKGRDNPAGRQANRRVEVIMKMLF